MKKFSAKDVSSCGLCVALMVICAWASIEIPTSEISITLQTFAVFFALAALGGRRGTITTLAYILLGAVGLPVFSKFQSTTALFGPTGGYIVGFLVAALLYWAMEAALGSRYYVKIAAMVLGNLVCYAFGTMWFYIVYLNRGTPLGIGAILGICVVPYIPFDLVKIAGAYFLSAYLHRALHGKI